MTDAQTPPPPDWDAGLDPDARRLREANRAACVEAWQARPYPGPKWVEEVAPGRWVGYARHPSGEVVPLDPIDLARWVPPGGPTPHPLRPREASG